MYDSFRGNGVFIFSDPAGAKACLALAAMLAADQAPVTCRLISNKHYGFYKDWPLHVEVDEYFTLGALPEKPDWVFTGTSHPVSSTLFEVKRIEEAKALGIPVTSFIDHWTNMALRFRKDGKQIWPDAIWVVDMLAREKALEALVPSELIVIAGSPYLRYIKKYWKSRHLQDEDKGEPYILYAPDPISLRNDDRQWKFDEYTVLEQIADLVKDTKEMSVVVKTHPLQPAEPMQAVIARLSKQKGVKIHWSDADGLELANAATVVVGFHSNFLLEAAALGKPVLRYFPESAEMDAIAHLEIGEKITSFEGLRQAVEKIFKHEHPVSER